MHQGPLGQEGPSFSVNTRVAASYLVTIVSYFYTLNAENAALLLFLYSKTEYVSHLPVSRRYLKSLKNTKISALLKEQGKNAFKCPRQSKAAANARRLYASDKRLKRVMARDWTSPMRTSREGGKAVRLTKKKIRQAALISLS